MTDKEFIDFLLDMLNVKINGDTINDDNWLVLIREMDGRGYPLDFFDTFYSE